MVLFTHAIEALGVITGKLKFGQVYTENTGEGGLVQPGGLLSVCETETVPPPKFHWIITLFPLLGPMIVPFVTVQL